MDESDLKVPQKVRTRKDKADRATVEGVLDRNTRRRIQRILLQHMTKEERESGVAPCLQGSISMGKEANVFRVEMPDGSLRVIKVYNTSILVFKDRERYVIGEHRFQSGYTKNPRKMVSMWCMKELRNLHRLKAAGLSVPEAYDARANVLLMQHMSKMGDPSEPALRLKDIKWTGDPRSGKSRVKKAWLKTCRAMWMMHNVAGLVHGDLSEYNMLYSEDAAGRGEVFVIDVSQSVEHDHPMAFDFLRRDVKNVIRYFRDVGVKTLSCRTLYDWITDPKYTPTKLHHPKDDDWEEYVAGMMARATADLKELQGTADADPSPIDTVDEAVWEKEFVHRDLDDVGADEADVRHMLKGTWDGFDGSEEDSDTDDDTDDEDDDDEDDDEDDEENPNMRYARKDMTKDEWREEKRRIKEERREKRKTKVSKVVKRRAKVLSMRNRKK